MGREHLIDIVLRFEVGDGISLEEVAHVLLGEEVVLLLLAVVVDGLEAAHELIARAVNLGGVEAKLAGAHDFLHSGLESLLGLSVLGHNDEAEGILSLADEVVVVTNHGSHEGAVGILGEFGEAGVERGGGHALHIVHHQQAHRTAHLGGDGILLEEHLDDSLALLLVLINDIDGLGVVGHGIEFVGGRVFLRLDSRENALDFCFNLIYINITNDDDTLKVGAIPLLVVGAEEVGLEVVDDAHQTDGHTLAVARTRIEVGQLAVEDTHHSTAAHTPLLVDDTALLVDFGCLEEKAIGPVVENPEAGVDVAIAHGHAVNVVNGFVGGGVGIEVLAKFHADAFAILNDAVAGEVLGAVEAHVLEEVGQTALVLFFLYRTYLLRDIEVNTLFGQGIVTDVVGQSVGQFAVTHSGVNGQHRHLLCKSRCYAGSTDYDSHEQKLQEFEFLHKVCSLCCVNNCLVKVSGALAKGAFVGQKYVFFSVRTFFFTKNHSE